MRVDWAWVEGDVSVRMDWAWVEGDLSVRVDWAYRTDCANCSFAGSNSGEL